MARLPDVSWDDLTLEQQALWPDGRMIAPYRVLMNVPEIGETHFRLSRTLRGATNFPAQLQELATLTTAREQNCQYVWAAHNRIARDAGTRPEALDAVSDGMSLTGLTDDEALVVGYTQKLIGPKQVSDATFQSALSRFGQRGVLELTHIVAYYLMMCAVNNAFEVSPEDDGMQRLLPE